MGDPTDFAGDNGYSDVFGGMSQGWMGDGYYMGVVSGMFYVAPAYDELGYSNSVYRWLGENLIRPLVGDETLANATDAQLLAGTAIFVTVAVVGVYFAPAIYSSMSPILATMNATFLGRVAVGAISGAVYSIAAQMEAGSSLFDVNWNDVGSTALTGALTGAVMTSGFAFLQAVLPGFCAAATVFGAGSAVYGAYNGYNKIQDGKYLTGTLDIVFSVFALRHIGQGLCFVVGTQVVRHAVLAQLANTHDTSDETSAEASAWNGEYLALTAGLLAAGFCVAPDALERRRKQAARRLLFGSSVEFVGKSRACW